MGIIIGDTITLNNGLTVTNTYCSFGNSKISLRKNINNTYDSSGNIVSNINYTLYCNYCIWINKTYRLNNNVILESYNINKDITSSDLNTNLYSILYTEIKSKYTSTTDDI